MRKKTYWKAESFLALDFPAKGDLIMLCSPDLMREKNIIPRPVTIGKYFTGKHHSQSHKPHSW